VLTVLTAMSCLLSLGAVGVTIFFYWRFSRRQEISRERVSNQIQGILSEFNAASSDKIELLEERTEELRRVVDIADLKTKKLNRLIDQAEGLKKVLKQEKQQRKNSDAEDESTSESHRERILSLAEDGYTPSQIAEKTGIKPGEVSVIIRLNRSRLSGTGSGSVSS
jgi:DNA-directed RNA polymerase specialized sigma24 family protein